MSDIVKRAEIFARVKHLQQKDDNGQDYFTNHITKVVEMLRVVTNDSEILAAGYLHDIIEDTDTSYPELCFLFGDKIADLVMEVTHEGKKDEQGYYFPRLHSKEGIILKFADRLSNISRMDSWDKERQEQYLRKSKFWRDGK